MISLKKLKQKLLKNRKEFMFGISLFILTQVLSAVYYSFKAGNFGDNGFTFIIGFPFIFRTILISSQGGSAPILKPEIFILDFILIFVPSATLALMYRRQKK